MTVKINIHRTLTMFKNCKNILSFHVPRIAWVTTATHMVSTVLQSRWSQTQVPSYFSLSLSFSLSSLSLSPLSPFSLFYLSSLSLPSVCLSLSSPVYGQRALASISVSLSLQFTLPSPADLAQPCSMVKNRVFVWSESFSPTDFLVGPRGKILTIQWKIQMIPWLSDQNKQQQ